MRQNYYVRNRKSGVVHRTVDTNFWNSEQYETLTQAEGKRLYREQETKALRKLLRPGARVYVKQNSVSGSGMYRRLDLYIVRKGELQRITYSAAIVMDWPLNDNGIGVSGCGMDMHFHTVYSLARYLFPNGFKEKKVEQRDGGYALTHTTI